MVKSKDLVEQPLPDIYTYNEYRIFLKDSFEALKANSKKLSYRTFAKNAGFSSPNFLQMVIQGKRSFNFTHSIAVAKVFKLNKQESEFFQNLVGYDQAKSFDEKNTYYQKILRNKRYTTIKALDKSQYEFFSHWYIPAVRELMTHDDFKNNSSWIADKIYPRITVSQVESARTILQKLNLIAFDEIIQKWKFSNSVIRSESESSHLGLRNYHKSGIQLAQQALEKLDSNQRDIRSVTLGLPKSAFKDLKSRIESFWIELMDFAGSQTQTEEVYQINLQLFPLSKGRKD